MLVTTKLCNLNSIGLHFTLLVNVLEIS